MDTISKVDKMGISDKIENDINSYQLTPEETFFAINFVKGMSRVDSYCKAYPEREKKWQRNVLINKASEMYNRPNVKQYVHYLQQQVVERTMDEIIIDKTELTKKLAWLVDTSQEDIVNRGMRQANSTTMLNSIKELVEIGGFKAETNARVHKIEADTQKVYAEIDKMKGNDSLDTGALIQNFIQAIKPADENEDIESLYE